MQTIPDLVADARERDGPLFATAGGAAPYSYADFCTNGWKTGNVLSHYGVREGERVAVVVGPNAPGEDDVAGALAGSPTPLQALLGAMVDGAVVDPDPVGVVDATVLVAPNAWIDDYQWGPGTKPVAYGQAPDDARVAHLEGEAWSENPTEPPAEVGPRDDALAADRLFSHGDLLAASRRVVGECDLTVDDRVAIRAPVTDAGTLVAGLFAPMRVGATVLLDGDEVGTVAVAAGDAPEDRVVDPATASP